jgi:hypothetical protein
MRIMKPLVTEPRQRLRRGAVKRFLQEDYVVKKHNHTCDYTMDMSMYLCPISFQTMSMYRTGSHMHVFLDSQDNNTKHDYYDYTVQEIFDGTEEWIKDMMCTTHKNRRDRVNKETDSGRRWVGPSKHKKHKHA